MSPRLLALGLPLLIAGCGSSEKPAASAKPAAAKTATVAIKSFKYKPANVHVRAGGTVTFVNQDSAGHTATFTTGPSKLDTDRLGRGDKAALTFPKAGRYAYVCAFHAFMKGEVVVGD
ncbi:MAG: plastocyanin/azurin family copper-binding protein [Solirubrobacteraceae bacterium]